MHSSGVGSKGRAELEKRAQGLMRELLESSPDRSAYALLLRRLLSVSLELDRALEQVDLPMLRAAHDASHSRRLWRRLYEQGTAPDLDDGASEAVHAMTCRIRTLLNEEPLLLLAHVFAREARDAEGDGGTADLARALQAESPAVIAPALDRFDPFFRSIDRLPLARTVKRRLYDEGIRCQALNLRLVRELHHQFLVV
ncbi:MAG: hypothetical protein HC923_11480 [Myxococcales bacterium]|nr:hypothetical protein [Myxococcales bacterium]